MPAAPSREVFPTAQALGGLPRGSRGGLPRGSRGPSRCASDWRIARVSVHLRVLRLQLFLGLRVLGVLHDAAVDGADLDAAGVVVGSHALRALLGIDEVDRIPRADGRVGALRLARAAADALGHDLHRHELSSSSEDPGRTQTLRAGNPTQGEDARFLPLWVDWSLDGRWARLTLYLRAGMRAATGPRSTTCTSSTASC